MSNQKKTTIKEELLPQYDIVVIGSGGTGKSCLTNQFVTGVFTEDYDPTIEDSYRKRVCVDGEMGVLDILDTAGQEEYSSMLDEYLRRGQGFILVYAITSNASFSEVQNFKEKLWICKDLKQSERVPFILVGNKADLESERQVTTGEGQDLAKFFGCPFFEASAKTAVNVNEIFHQIVREIRKDIEAKGLQTKKTEAPDEAYYQKLVKKFSKWKVKMSNFDFGGAMSAAKEKISRLSKAIFSRGGKDNEEEEKNNTGSGISSPSPNIASPSMSQTNISKSVTPNSGSFINSSPKPLSNGQGNMDVGSLNDEKKGQAIPQSNSSLSLKTSGPVSSSPSSSPHTYGKIPEIVKQAHQPQGPPDFTIYPWFHPTMSGPEADRILGGAQPGTFLIRPSSQPEHLAVSYVDGGVQKALIAFDKAGKNYWMAENPAVKYPSLDKLVASLNRSLMIPYTRK